MKKWLIASVSIVAVALIGYFGYSGWMSSKRSPMVASLKDPDAAQFRNEHLGKNSNLCGEVNSKNAMGAYVGFTRYISNKKSYAIEGYSVTSFALNDEEKNQYLIRNIEINNSVLKGIIKLAKEDRAKGIDFNSPSDLDITDMVNKQAFDELWKQYCSN